MRVDRRRLEARFEDGPLDPQDHVEAHRNADQSESELGYFPKKRIRPFFFLGFSSGGRSAAARRAR